MSPTRRFGGCLVWVRGVVALATVIGLSAGAGLGHRGIPNNGAARLVRAPRVGWSASGLERGTSLLDQAPLARRLPSVHRHDAHIRDRCPHGGTAGRWGSGL